MSLVRAFHFVLPRIYNTSAMRRATNSFVIRRRRPSSQLPAAQPHTEFTTRWPVILRRLKVAEGSQRSVQARSRRSNGLSGIQRKIQTRQRRRYSGLRPQNHLPHRSLAKSTGARRSKLLVGPATLGADR